MHSLTINIPEEFEKKDVLLSIACQLHATGVLSVKQAADLAGTTTNKLIMSMLPDKDPLRQLLRPDDSQGDSLEKEVADQIKQKEYKGQNKERLEAMRDSLNIQEPLEILLSQLRK
ncbi:hypothetical protein [Dyadobacter bucti]|uniref:hypothetical protein n=1 Tax=Dyadobacter bucti TaxID=2572203 RepID=UPI003F71E13C